MRNKYLNQEVGQTEFNNFFHKLEHSISIANTHDVISDSEYEKCRTRLVKKFMASLEKGKYKCVAPRLSIGHVDGDIKIKKGEVIDLLGIDKKESTVSIGIGDYEYGMGFQIMLNFEPHN